MEKKKIIKWSIPLAAVIVLLIFGIGYCAKATITQGELIRRLEEDGTDVIELDGIVKIKKPLVVNGEKTLTGNGSIVLQADLDGEWPDEDSKNNTWGTGCTKLHVEDTERMAAVLTVNDNAVLNVEGSVKVDANKKANGVHVMDGGELVLDDEGTVHKGRYANLVVTANGTATIQGGKVLDAQSFGVINAGALNIEGGILAGADRGAVLFNTGKTVQSAGTIEKAGIHNVYVEDGTFVMSGGTNNGAKKDGIVVSENGEANVSGGDITNCAHGLCNNGKMEVGKVVLSECGIMNYKTGNLTMVDTTVDTSAVYCLANNGGKVKATGFTAKKCDTCAVYNFAGDMELANLTITGSRDGNISNAGGTMTVNGATLDKCRDKSIVVGSGKAIFNDITLAGTSRGKYGVYVYGGELFVTKATVYDVSSTAFKVDTGGYLEAKEIDMKDIAEIGFRADGGKIVAEDIEMENLGSHAVYNLNGDITVSNAVIDGIKKNALQQKGGKTVLNGIEADNIGNHGAYIELGNVTITESTLKNMTGNGLYMMAGDNSTTLKNVVLEGAGKQGINNSSDVMIDGLTVKNAAQNGIFNKDNGTVTAKNVVISHVGEHGVNNYNTMSLKGAKISNTGKGSNGLQNKGILTIDSVTVEDSKNHGAYNTGTIQGTELYVKKAKENGVYNDKGTFSVKAVCVDETGKHGLNNAAKMLVSDVIVNHTGVEKNSVQNTGTLEISHANLENSKNHGIYNTGSITGNKVSIYTSAKNGVYNAKGTAEIAGLNIENTGEHGINNEAKLIVSNVKVDKTGKEKNSIQNTGAASISDATLKNSRNHGIYNKGTISGKNINITGSKGNGFYNNAGTSNIKMVTINNVGEHGINNESIMTISNADIQNTGKGKNGIQNKGTLTAENNVVIDGSKNHGIYNSATIIATGNMKVTNSKVNALYNYQGSFKGAVIEVDVTGEHGINNASKLEVKTVVVSRAGQNAIQNSGEMTVSKAAVLKDSGKHGIFNGDKFEGTSIKIENVGDLSFSNNGNTEIYELQIWGTASKAIYNSGYAELYKTTIDGTAVENSGAEYLVDNNGGVLDLTNSTIKNAKGTALHLRGNASASVTNVIINQAGSYGAFIENGSSLSGDGLEINNITKSTEVYGAEGIAIKNAGKVTMLDHVTIGADDPEVEGSGAEVETTLNELVNNAVVNDSATSSYSGYDLVIKNAINGCAIYNKGVAYVTDLDVDRAKDGIATRYNSWVTLAGNIHVTNSSRNPFVTYGPTESNDSNTYRNGITIASGAKVIVDGSVGHGINNKGSFLAAADTDITFKNITGQNVNAVNNQKTGTMTLGDVCIDGVRVEVTGTNTNSATALMVGGDTTLDGHIEISNVYFKGNQDNTNGSGVVVRNNGVLKGNGSVTVKGAIADGDWKGTYNGLFVDQRSVELGGDVVVTDVSNQGIYLANKDANLKAANVTVTNVGANAFYINKSTGWAQIGGTLNTVSPVKGRGINNSGSLECGNIVVTDVKNNYNAIENSGTISVTGDLTVERVTNAAGIRNKGTVTVQGTTKINDISGTKNVNGIQQDGGKTMNLKDVIISNIKQTSSADTYGNGMAIKGTLNLSGTATITNINPDNTSGSINGANAGIANYGTIKGTGDIVISNTGGHGIYAKGGKFNLNNITVSDTGLKSAMLGMYLEGASEMKANNIVVDHTGKQGIQLQHANTLIANNVTIQNTEQNGLRLYNSNSNPTVTIGKLTTINCKQYGINAQKSISSGIAISEMWYKNCGSGVVHGNIKSGVATPQQITQQEGK